MGIYAPGGALNVALNDTTGTGAYTSDGKLRVTDVAGQGITDHTGAWRIVSTIAQGVYEELADAIRYVDATIDGALGIQAVSGPIRMVGVTSPPSGFTWTYNLGAAPTGNGMYNLIMFG